jgi:tetratricopeptide (TPR) repeat protein
VRRHAGRGVLAVALLAVLAGTTEAAPDAVVLPEPELVVTPTPVPLAAERPPLAPPPPLPSLRARAVDLGPPPLPRFDSAFTKPLPPFPETGGFPCGLSAMFGRPIDFVRCGTVRLRDGERARAREALEEALTLEPAGPQAAVAAFWLGEIDLLERRDAAAAARYRRALELGLSPDLAAHASFGLGWIALRAGDPRGALEAIARAPAPAPAGLRFLLRFAEGLAHLLQGDAGAAFSRWEAAPDAPAPAAIGAEAAFWRGVALLQRWEPEPALHALEEAVRGLAAGHPLAAEARAQRGWAQLLRGMASRAQEDFTRAAASAAAGAAPSRHFPGLVRAYVAQGRYAEARGAVAKLALEQPGTPLVVPLLFHIAEEAQRRHALPEALETYRELRARSLEPTLRAHATYRTAEAFEQLAAAGSPTALQRAAGEYRRLRDEGGDEGLAQRAAYWLAFAALQEGRPVSALAECEELLRAGPSPDLHARVLILAGEAAARAGAPNRAVRLFRSALAASPDTAREAELRLALGWALREDGEVGVALQEWQRAARLGDPRIAAAAFEALAATALEHGYDAEALGALEELERRVPTHPERPLITLNRGVLLARMRDDPGAIETLRPLLAWAASPEREAAVRRTLGIVLYRGKQDAEARALFQEAAQREPGNAANWLGAGLAAYRLGRAADADRALQRARVTADREIATTATYAFVLVRQSDPNEFRRRAGAFIANYPAQPHSALLVTRLVTDALAQGEGQYALAWTRWLVKEQPAGAQVEPILARMAEAEYRDPALAREAYGEVVAQSRNVQTRLLGHLGLARTAAGIGRSHDAREALGRFIDEAPAADARLPWAYQQLARLYEAEGQRERVLATVDAFLARFPGHPGAPAMRLRRGEILMAAQRWEVAQEALEAARDGHDPAVSAQAHVRLGELHRARGDDDHAVEEYLAAIYLYPATRSAALGLQGAAQSYAQRGRPQDARIVLEKLAAHGGADARLVQWARDELRRLPRAPAPDPEPAPRPGARSR